MRIAMLGSGSVGQTLGAALASRGHDVKMGSRDPGKLAEWVASTGAGASAGTFAEAAEHGELAFLVTNWDGTRNALELAGADRLSGKVLIDVTNALDFSHGMPPRLAVSGDSSAGELVQSWVPGARVVKAFNTIGAPIMVDPCGVTGDQPTLFIAGEDEDAKRAVTEIARAFGWTDVVDLGGIAMAGYLEALAMVWIVHMARTQSLTHAVKLLPGRGA